MRSKRTRMFDTRTKIHIFSGGIKEDAAQVELRGGELIDCNNYQEIDGVYHGYLSIPGYEAMDGTPLASSVPTITVADYGRGKKTVLLLETKDNPIIDSSVYQNPIVNNGVILYTDPANFNTKYSKFFDTSFVFDGLATLSATHVEAYNLDIVDYTFDTLMRMDNTTGEQIIFEKAGSYKLFVDSGVVKFSVSTDGMTYTDTIVSNTTINANSRYHLEVSRRSGVFRMFLNGETQNDTMDVPTVINNTNAVVIGSSFVGQMSEFRFSAGVYLHYRDFEIPTIPYSTKGYYTYQIDDVDREIRRSAIEPIPGYGPVLGVAINRGLVYGVRNAEDNLSSSMYVVSDTGWSPITGSINPNGVYHFCSCSFDELVDHQRERVLFFASSVDYPMYVDNSTLVEITSEYLPDDPNNGYCATMAIEFKNRLFLAYPGGRLVFSAVGNPLDFDPVSGGGELYLEDDVTNIVAAPGDTLVVYCRNSTHTLKALTDLDNASASTTATYKFRHETFSKQSGAIKRTAKRILGTVVSMSDRGLTNLETTDAYGDFSVAFLSKNVQNTLFKNKNLLTTSIVHRKNNQYRLFFSSGMGLVFTFDVEKKVKGVTKMMYPIPVLNIFEGDDVNEDLMIVFSSSDGYVYKMDSGTSFNGADIETRIVTSFDSYSSPTMRKRFRKLSLELKADRDTEVRGRLVFDYGDPGVPRTAQEEMISKGEGGIWGTDRWGLFTYGSAVTQNPTLYASGYGKNMSIQIITKDKYRNPHVLNSAIVEYTFVGHVM